MFNFSSPLWSRCDFNLIGVPLLMLGCGQPTQQGAQGAHSTEDEGTLRVLVETSVPGVGTSSCPFMLHTYNRDQPFGLIINHRDDEECDFYGTRLFGTYDLVATRVYDSIVEIGILGGQVFDNSQVNSPFIVQAVPAARLEFVYTGPRPADLFVVASQEGVCLYREAPNLEYGFKTTSGDRTGRATFTMPLGEILLEVLDLETGASLGSQMIEVLPGTSNTVAYVHASGFKD